MLQYSMSPLLISERTSKGNFYHSAIHIYFQINMAQKNKYKENKDRYKFHFNIFISIFKYNHQYRNPLSSTLHMLNFDMCVISTQDQDTLTQQKIDSEWCINTMTIIIITIIIIITTVILIKYKSNCIWGKATWISVNLETKRTLNWSERTKQTSEQGNLVVVICQNMVAGMVPRTARKSNRGRKTKKSRGWFFDIFYRWLTL